MKLEHRKISTFEEAILPCSRGFYIGSVLYRDRNYSIFEEGKTIQNYIIGIAYICLNECHYNDF